MVEYKGINNIYKIYKKNFIKTVSENIEKKIILLYSIYGKLYIRKVKIKDES